MADAGRPAGRGEGRRRPGRARDRGRDGVRRRRPRRRSGRATAGADGDRPCRSTARSCRRSPRRRPPRPRPSRPRPPRPASACSDAAAVVPIQRAVPATGLRELPRAGCRTPTMMPKTASAISRTKAPGAENRSVRVPDEGPPDPAARDAQDLGCPGDAGVGDREAEEGDPPARIRAASRDPIRATSRRAGSKNGATQRIVPNHGAKTSVHQLVRVPCRRAGHQGDERHRAEDEQRQADDRADDVRGQPRAPGRSCCRARDGRVAGGLRAVVRRRVATSDLDDDREDHRPALRLLVQEARDAVLDLGLEQRRSR